MLNIWLFFNELLSVVSSLKQTWQIVVVMETFHSLPNRLVSNQKTANQWEYARFDFLFVKIKER